MRITIKNLQTTIPLSSRPIIRAIREILAKETALSDGEINVSYVTDKAITRLNRRYHRRNMPTDVLAFDLSERDDTVIADIYISADTAVKNARAFKTSPRSELLLYAVHGMLHIAGFRDRTAAQRRIMRKKEAYYLNRLLDTRHKDTRTQV